MSKTLKKHLTEPIVDPILIRDDESDTYDTDYSHVSYQEEKQLRRIPRSKNFQNCKCESNGKAHTKNVTFSPRTAVDDDELMLRRQKLELNLSNAQMEEALSTDYHKNLQSRYERVESALEAFIYYIDTISLEMKACYRLSRKLNCLVTGENSLINDNLSEMTKKVCEETDLQFGYNIKSKIYSLLENKSDILKFVEDYNTRKRDFKVASQNFKILLDSANLNLRQMDKLQQQYDNILSNYKHSRCMLDEHIPDIISQRVNVLLNCLCEFSVDLERTANERSEMGQLFQHLESSLKLSTDLAMRKVNDMDCIDEEMKSPNCCNCSPRSCTCMQ